MIDCPVCNKVGRKQNKINQDVEHLAWDKHNCKRVSATPGGIMFVFPHKTIYVDGYCSTCDYFDLEEKLTND